MKLTVERGSRVPIYLQLVRQIRDLIASGTLVEGTLLPPERTLARQLGVNRSTVLNAYRALKEDRILEARVGRGTSVLPQPARKQVRTGGRELPWRQLFRDRSSRAGDAVLRDLLELSEREGTIPLALGLPAPELLPLEVFRELIVELTAELGPRSLLHSPTEGITHLREALCGWAEERGIAADPSEVQILSGSQQGLDMAARVFLEPGDAVVLEEPTYIGALQTFRDAQARLIGVPTDEDGLRTDVLADILNRRRPKFIYTLPTYQNPSGVVMSLERRHHLLELAHRHQVPILEDDPYSDLNYTGESIPPLKALDRYGLVIYFSTMSKVLFPGLRLGWVIAPRPAVRQFSLVKQGMDLHSNTPGQFLLARYLERDYHRKYLTGIRRVYVRRRDIMNEALKKEEVPGLSWRRPDGGFYIWVTLPEAIDRTRLLARAAEAGVSFLPGWACFAEDPGRSHLRLNFAFPSEEQIKIGVTRLLAAIRYATARSATARKDEVGTPPVV